MNLDIEKRFHMNLSNFYILSIGRYAYPWWKEKIINSDLKRKDGLCPLTPEETALTLKALDIDQNIQNYTTAGKIYSGERRMASLAKEYPKLVNINTQGSMVEISTLSHAILYIKYSLIIFAEYVNLNLEFHASSLEF